MSIYSEPIEWMKEAINSILNQTFTDFEFIIVNDKPSRKENIELLKAYQQKDKRIQVVENKQNIGLTKSLNKGLLLAKGTYIARMDADDFSYPTRFEKQVHFLDENKEYVVCGTNIEYFGENKIKLTREIIKVENIELKAQLIKNSCFAHPTVMIRKQILIDNQIKYNEDFIQAQDYKLWSDLSTLGRYYNIKEILLKYRVSDNQVSKKSSTNQNINGNKIRTSCLSVYLDLQLIEKLVSKDADFKILFKVKKELKLKKVSKLIYKNILFVSYLSIKKKTLILLLYYFFSLDFMKYISEPLDILRIVESCIFPNKKPKRLY
ncbi:glycosyltransferase [Tenacibaculum dicentrarchi]|uniref:glycosyltransferase n=1 Tax=Tenacibaculum dicentrarchi TaxID=669041 RepID=UPI0035192117